MVCLDALVRSKARIHVTSSLARIALPSSGVKAARHWQENRNETVTRSEWGVQIVVLSATRREPVGGF